MGATLYACDISVKVAMVTALWLESIQTFGICCWCTHMEKKITQLKWALCKWWHREIQENIFHKLLNGAAILQDNWKPDAKTHSALIPLINYGICNDLILNLKSVVSVCLMFLWFWSTILCILALSSASLVSAEVHKLYMSADQFLILMSTDHWLSSTKHIKSSDIRLFSHSVRLRVVTCEKVTPTHTRLSLTISVNSQHSSTQLQHEHKSNQPGLH